MYSIALLFYLQPLLRNGHYVIGGAIISQAQHTCKKKILSATSWSGVNLIGLRLDVYNMILI
jgi:hypothetical protein